jgi:hypothetical protein
VFSISVNIFLKFPNWPTKSFLSAHMLAVTSSAPKATRVKGSGLRREREKERLQDSGK